MFYQNSAVTHLMPEDSLYICCAKN